MPTWIRLDGEARPLNRRHAAIAAVVVGAAIAGLVIRAGDSPPGSADIDQVWFAARALLAGQNPYEMIGPGRAFDYPWPLYYPLPAVVLLAPLAPLPLVWTRLAIAVIPAALLAYLLARRDWRWLSLCCSRAFILAATAGQWTLLYLCALFITPVAAFFPAKPNLALGIAAGFENWRQLRRAVLWAAIPLGISLVWQPTWPVHWLAAVQSAEHIRPMVVFPGGALLLLAALRWKAPEGRLAMAMVLLPQTVTVMTTVPFLLLVKSWRALLVLSMLTYLHFYMLRVFPDLFAWMLSHFESVTELTAFLAIVTVPVPAVLMLVWSTLARRRGEHSAPGAVREDEARLAAK